MKKNKYQLDELLKGINKNNLHKKLLSNENLDSEYSKCKTEVPSKGEYKKACERMEELLHLVNNNTPESDPNFQELDQVSDIVIAYEEEYYPIGEPTLEYKGYIGTVEFDEELKVYHGLVKDIEPDVVAYDGNTLEELEESFRNGIELHLEGKSS